MNSLIFLTHSHIDKDGNWDLSKKTEKSFRKLLKSFVKESDRSKVHWIVLVSGLSNVDKSKTYVFRSTESSEMITSDSELSESQGRAVLYKFVTDKVEKGDISDKSYFLDLRPNWEITKFLNVVSLVIYGHTFINSDLLSYGVQSDRLTPSMGKFSWTKNNTYSTSSSSVRISKDYLLKYSSPKFQFMYSYKVLKLFNTLMESKLLPIFKIGDISDKYYECYLARTINTWNDSHHYEVKFKVGMIISNMIRIQYKSYEEYVSQDIPDELLKDTRLKVTGEIRYNSPTSTELGVNSGRWVQIS
jgi:hypothetical protein